MIRSEAERKVRRIDFTVETTQDGGVGYVGESTRDRAGAHQAHQRTLKNVIGCSGIGLHSGAKVHMMLRPGKPDTGIVFRRIDLARCGATLQTCEIRADVAQVVDARMGTTLGNDAGTSVATIEHLMAALRGASIDNIVVELDAAEVPIMDGSAAPFVFLLECAGTREQKAARRYIEILEPVEVIDGDKSASLSPAAGFSLGFEIDFDRAAVGQPEFGSRFQLINGNVP